MKYRMDPESEIGNTSKDLEQNGDFRCARGERSKNCGLLSGSTKSASEASDSEEASTVGTGVRSPNSISSKLASAGLP